jgi:hypothetical protein
MQPDGSSRGRTQHPHGPHPTSSSLFEHPCVDSDHETACTFYFRFPRYAMTTVPPLGRTPSSSRSTSTWLGGYRLMQSSSLFSRSLVGNGHGPWPDFLQCVLLLQGVICRCRRKNCSQLCPSVLRLSKNLNLGATRALPVQVHRQQCTLVDALLLSPCLAIC